MQAPDGMASALLSIVAIGMILYTPLSSQELHDSKGDSSISVPNLIAMDRTAYQGNSTPTMDWYDVPGAASYTLEYADNSDFRNSMVVRDIQTSQYTLARSSSPAIDGTFSMRPWPTDYHWRVKAVGEQGESSFSPSHSFVIESAFPTWPVLLLALVVVVYMFWQVFV